MNTDHEGPGAPVPDELDSTAEENEAVQALYGDRDPTRALEERVVADWRHAVPRTRRPGLKPLAQAAALVVAFWGGTRLGSGAPERPRIKGDDTAQQFVVGPILEPRYAFLIYTDPAVSPSTLPGRERFGGRGERCRESAYSTTAGWSLPRTPTRPALSTWAAISSSRPPISTRP